MIIWLNGAFGSGKTQTAYELHRRISNSFVYDPEEVGFFLQDNMPRELKMDDYQDFPMWREFNFKILDYLDDKYNGIVIVPMTIIDQTYFQEIIENLRDADIDLRHFTLMATEKTLLKRLKSRGDRESSWPAQQINRCLNSLHNQLFAQHIYTDDLTIDQVANYIAKMCQINLLSDDRNRLQKRWDKTKIWFKHIRLFR